MRRVIECPCGWRFLSGRTQLRRNAARRHLAQHPECRAPFLARLRRGVPESELVDFLARCSV